VKEDLKTPQPKLSMLNELIQRSVTFTPRSRVSDLVLEENLDLTARETHERLKESNKNVLLTTNTQRFWSRTMNSLSYSLITGAVIGSVLSLGTPVVIAAVCLAAAGMLSSHLIDQNAASQMNDNNHDVSDYYNRRQAKYIAQELDKVLEAHDQKHHDTAPDAQVHSGWAEKEAARRDAAASQERTLH
jgi:hypothetical protein